MGVGDLDGFGVGDLDGFGVGLGVGDLDAFGVGDLDGFGVGLGVGVLAAGRAWQSVAVFAPALVELLGLGEVAASRSGAAWAVPGKPESTPRMRKPAPTTLSAAARTCARRMRIALSPLLIRITACSSWVRRRLGDGWVSIVISGVRLVMRAAVLPIAAGPGWRPGMGCDGSRSTIGSVCRREYSCNTAERPSPRSPRRSRRGLGVSKACREQRGDGRCARRGTLTVVSASGSRQAWGLAYGCRCGGHAHGPAARRPSSAATPAVPPASPRPGWLGAEGLLVDGAGKQVRRGDRHDGCGDERPDDDRRVGDSRKPAGEQVREGRPRSRRRRQTPCRSGRQQPISSPP